MTYIHSDSVVMLLKNLAGRFFDRPISLVLDNARYQRNTYVMSEADRLGITWLWRLPYYPHLNLIKHLGKFVKVECLHGRKIWAFKQVLTNCLAETDERHQSKLNILLTLNFQVFKPPPKSSIEIR